MDPVLLGFVSVFEASFKPPVPYRGTNGGRWLISKVWSVYMKAWLQDHYSATYEYRLNQRRRLDAALWPKQQNGATGTMDIALEWEWDNSKVAKAFPSGDFRKLFEVNARCGVAIVHTRADRKDGANQAAETLTRLRRSSKKYRRDNRPVALIEIRRVLDRKQRVDFVCNLEDMNTEAAREIARWTYSSTAGS